ncbi:hypothetical protein Bpfe_003050 [Biomphalaria pfeifferi]|uniref:Uncharacterized protein n=1 Tax=Biomphalaria pfeifferi TaxID=112525 RepID=A0AAD8C7H4_BIOPF|nr:hypothetical protein Bpfe_003050 [Biomphalaria pfeifferi]
MSGVWSLVISYGLAITLFLSQTQLIVLHLHLSQSDTTHNLTLSPVTMYTGSTTIHTDATSQGFSSDTIYIITSVASIGLVIVGVIAFFVIRNYRNKRGFYDVQKFHRIHLCRLN